MNLQNHLAPVPASGEEPIELLRARYGHFLAEKWHGHVLERARYRQIAERIGKGNTPDEPDEPSDEDLATATAIIPATRDNIAKYHGWATLAQLTTAHMPDPLAKSYTAMVERVREWRNAQTHPATTGTATAMILASASVGIGKTHIAAAVAASYNDVWGEDDAAFVDGKPNFHVSKNGRFYTAADLMRLMDDDEYDPARLIPPHVKCVVIDDVGREGEIKYTARTAQAAEREHRYFGLINYLYTRKNVALFMTTNLTVAQLSSHFSEATMSRLYEMTQSRYLLDIVTRYPDVRRIKSANGGKL